MCNATYFHVVLLISLASATWIVIGYQVNKYFFVASSKLHVICILSPIGLDVWRKFRVSDVANWKK